MYYILERNCTLNDLVVSLGVSIRLDVVNSGEFHIFLLSLDQLSKNNTLRESERTIRLNLSVCTTVNTLASTHDVH